jgi:hypothetical protein
MDLNGRDEQVKGPPVYLTLKYWICWLLGVVEVLVHALDVLFGRTQCHLGYKCSCGWLSKENFSAEQIFSGNMGQPRMHNLWFKRRNICCFTARRLQNFAQSVVQTTEHLLGVPVPQNGFAAYDINSSIKVSTVPQQQHNMLIAPC